MLTEPWQADGIAIKTFEASDENDLDGKVNDWLLKQDSRVVVLNMLFSYAVGIEGGEVRCFRSFALTLVYGNRPESTGNA